MAAVLRLLLVEDSADDAFLVVQALRRGGFEPQWERVDTPESLSDALGRPWDLITCDYVMPRLTPQDAFLLIRERNPDIPVVIVSGEVGEKTAAEAFDHGAAGYVSKSQLARLSGTVTRVLREAAERSARRRAEEIATFQARLLDAVGQAVIATDPRGRIVYVNRAAEALYGWPAGEMLGRQIDEVTPSPPSREAALDVLARLARGESWEGLFEVRRRDGSTFQAMVKDTPVRDTEGRLIAIIGVSWDVTDELKMRTALELSERKYRHLVETSHDLIWSVDRDGRITFINQAAREFYGREPDEMIGRRFTDFAPPGSAERQTEELRRLVATGDSVRGYEARMLRADGSEIILSANAVVQRDERGTIIGTIGSSSDVTDRRRAEDEIRELNADLERRVGERTAQLEAVIGELRSFSHSVSHDLRAPLRAIQGFAAILLEEHVARLDEDGRRCLERIAAAGRRMGELIEDLLSLSHVTQSDIQIRPVNLSDHARRIAAELSQSDPARRVRFEIASDLVAAADPRLLRLALDNLIGNAWKYSSTRETARIEFGASAASGEIVYFVRDNGVGFDPGLAEAVFEPFRRLHAEFEGTGVGLATVRRIIHRHGGRIWADAAVDGGARSTSRCRPRRGRRTGRRFRVGRVGRLGTLGTYVPVPRARPRRAH